MNRTTFWRELSEHLAGGEPAFVALVADHTRHSPGTRGARMFVRPDETTVGTIGGGVMEADCIERGLETLAGESTAPHSETLVHRRGPAQGTKSGLICAGEQTMVYAVAGPDDAGLFADVASRCEEDRMGLLCLDADGWRLDDDDTLDVERGPIRFEAGEEWSYTEQLLAYRRVVVIGGGHVGLAVSRTLAQLGYVVTLFETRANVPTLQANEWARHTIVVDDYAEAGEHVTHPEISHLVVVTADQPSDVRALLGTIELPFPYKGVMGAPAKLRKIANDLAEAGIDPALFAELHAPIGLEMTSNTPAEIAISIAGEILREREELFPYTRPRD